MVSTPDFLMAVSTAIFSAVFFTILKDGASKYKGLFCAVYDYAGKEKPRKGY